MEKTVLLIANTTGCLYNFRYGLIKHLLSNGYEVITLAPYYSKEAYSQGAVENLTDMGVKCIDFNFNSKGMNPVEDLKLISRYKKEFKRINPDIILSYTIKSNIYGSIAARKSKYPIVANITGLGNLYANPGLVTRIADVLYKWAFKKTQRVFFQNLDDMDLFLKRKNVNRSQSERIPGSGINTESFIPVKKSNNLDKTVFLTIGRLIYDKGYSYYVDAIKEVQKEFKDVEFQVLGELGVNNPNAIPEETVNEWVEKRYINYLGTSSDVRKQIAECDVMVLPSIYREGVPRTLIEGAALGKPIITTDNVGCRDVVDNGKNGYLCKMKDSGDLKEKICDFLNLDNRDKEIMSKMSREKVLKEFDEKIIISKYMDIILELIG